MFELNDGSLSPLVSRYERSPRLIRDFEINKLGFSLFKILNKSFTSIDFDKRNKYLQFVGDNSELSNDEIWMQFGDLQFHKIMIIKRPPSPKNADYFKD